NVTLVNGQDPSSVKIVLKQKGRTISSDYYDSDFKISVEKPGQYELVVSARDKEWRYGAVSLPINVREDIPTDIGTIEINTEGLFRSVSFTPLNSLVNAGDMMTFRLSYG